MNPWNDVAGMTPSECGKLVLRDLSAFKYGTSRTKFTCYVDMQGCWGDDNDDVWVVLEQASLNLNGANLWSNGVNVCLDGNQPFSFDNKTNGNSNVVGTLHPLHSAGGEAQASSPIGTDWTFYFVRFPQTPFKIKAGQLKRKPWTITFEDQSGTQIDSTTLAPLESAHAICVCFGVYKM